MISNIVKDYVYMSEATEEFCNVEITFSANDNDGQLILKPESMMQPAEIETVLKLFHVDVMKKMLINVSESYPISMEYGGKTYRVVVDSSFSVKSVEPS